MLTDTYNKLIVRKVEQYCKFMSSAEIPDESKIQILTFDTQGEALYKKFVKDRPTLDA